MNYTQRAERREWLEYEIALYGCAPVNDDDRAQIERMQAELDALG